MPLIDALLLDPAPLNTWIAWRTDGVKGCGTSMTDPYDASTQWEPAQRVTFLNQNPFDWREGIASTDAPHGFNNGDLVTIKDEMGEGMEAYNGTFAVYGVTATMFKYQMAIQPLNNANNTHATAMRVKRLPLDDLLNSLPVNTRIHLGPSPPHQPFLTRGYAEGVSGGWQLKPGLKIIGSGMDVTEIQLVNAATADKHYFAFGHDLTTGDPERRQF